MMEDKIVLPKRLNVDLEIIKVIIRCWDWSSFVADRVIDVVATGQFQSFTETFVDQIYGYLFNIEVNPADLSKKDASASVSS